MKRFRIKPAEMGEAISLGVSILILGAVIIYLISGMMQDSSDYLALTARAEAPVRLENSHAFVIPVKIINDTSRSVAYVEISIDMGAEIRTVDIDYVPRHSERTIYLYADKELNPEQVRATPLYYKFD